MALTIQQLREKIVEAYKRAVQAADEAVGNAKAVLELDEDLKRVIRIFRDNRELLNKNLSQLNHAELLALAYIAPPELAGAILDYEQRAFSEEHAAVRAEFSSLPEDNLLKQTIRKDFADTLDLLKKLSEKHADDVALTEKILDVANSVETGKEKNTTRTLFEFYYAAPMSTAEAHVNKAAVTEKANKDLAHLASRSDLAAVILEAPSNIPLVRNAAATDAALNDTLVNHVRRNNTKEALKFAVGVITTEALCKLMQPTIGEWLAYKFWFGSHPSEKIVIGDVIDRLLSYKEDGESTLNKDLFKAFLAKKLLGREYWREATADQWKQILKFLRHKVGLEDSNQYLRQAEDQCREVLGDIRYQVLQQELSHISVPKTPGHHVEKLSGILPDISTPVRDVGRTPVHHSDEPAVSTSVAAMASPEAATAASAARSVGEMTTTPLPTSDTEAILRAELNKFISPIGIPPKIVSTPTEGEVPRDMLARTITLRAAIASRKEVSFLHMKSPEVVASEKSVAEMPSSDPEQSVAAMNTNSSPAAASVAAMVSSAGSVAAMSSDLKSVASMDSGGKNEASKGRKSPSPTRQQRFVALMEEEGQVGSVEGMSASVASPVVSVSASPQPNVSAAAMSDSSSHKGEEMSAGSSVAEMVENDQEKRLEIVVAESPIADMGSPSSPRPR